jgi:tol-pal system protein YbgF
VTPASRPLRTVAGAAFAVLAFSASGCVSTQDIEGLRAQIGELQRQVLQLQGQVASKQDLEAFQASIQQQNQTLLKAEADTRVELAQLESRIGEVRAQLEATNVNLGEASQQIAALVQDVRTRGAAVNAAPAAPTAVEDPKALYEAAYNEYLRGNYEAAMSAFQSYLAGFPATDLSDNATYWIGECHYRQKRFRQAIQEFDRLAQQFPRSDKLASASLKKGYALIELGERTQGVAQLRQVVRDFPAGDEANLARQRLRDLGIDQR